MSGVNVGTAFLQIVPSARGFASKLQGEVGGDLAKVGDQAGAKAGAAAGKSYSAGFRKAAAAGAALVAAAGAAFLKGSIEEAREAQKVGAQTEAVIKSTGGAANITAKQVGDLAGAISKKAGIDDEAIQSGANLLLTFKNVRNEAGKGNAVFNQATSVITDMSVAMGTDMKSSAILVGKALNDPVKGLSALSRVGVTFTEGQKKQIKALVDSGKAADAQKIILAELRSEFGGSAAAQATAADKMAVSWGNLQEMVGTKLIPAIDRALVAITKLVNYVSTHGGQVRTFATVVGGLTATLLILGTAAKVSAAGGLIAYIATTNIAAKAVRAFAGAQALLRAVMALNPFVLVIGGLVLLGAALVVAYRKSETFRNVVNGAFAGVRKAIAWVVSGVAKLMSTFAAMLRGLSKVPGFGWAKGAAWSMQNAAAQASRLAGAIHSIPSTKYVNISTRVTGPFANKVAAANLAGERAAGGPVTGGRTYLVGERGPELFTSRTSGSIIPNHKLRPAAAGQGALSGRLRLVVDGREFSAYVDDRADGRVGAAASSAARTRRAR